jgi:tetratricopeptide (TPR) repeat protein
VDVDYHDAVAWLAAAQRDLRAARLEPAQAAASRALAVLERELLMGDSEPWLEERRRRVADLALRGRECLAEVALRRGGPHVQEAIDHARAIVRAEPYRESAHALLMRAWAAQGDVAEALKAYEQLRVRLGEELGAAPGAELRALHDELLRTGRLAAAGAPPEAEVRALHDELLRTGRLAAAGAPPEAEVRAPHDELLRTGRLAAAGTPPGTNAPPRRLPASGPAPAPPRRPARGRIGFVGREAELAALAHAFDEAAAGGSPLVLLTGEAGIGKTRLAARFADLEARARGALALYGRCDEDAVVPYQPFVEALRRHLAAAWVRDALWERIPAHMAELARVLPELAAPGGGQEAPGAPRGDERYQLFDAVSALLGEASRAQPVLVVLDDLHWADTPTLLMLRQVVRSAAQGPMLVVGTYRETERGAALLGALADLQREHVVERIALRGLEEADAAALCRMGEVELPAGLAHELWARSRGNPFLLEELLRHRAASAGGAIARPPPPGSVPEAVKDLIAGRVARLSSELRAVLEIACVIGSEFSLSLLEALAGLAEDALDRALAEAVAARLVVEAPDAYGRFAFEHDLTRQTLYEQLTLARRARLHLRVGEALEQAAAGDPAAHLAELAHHFLLAPPERGLPRAADYAVRAARHAAGVLAYEEAVRHYGAALEALDRMGAGDERRYDVWMALGEAQVKSGRSSDSRESFRRAGELARALGSPARLAKAALGFARIAGGVIDEETVGVLEEALAAVGDHDDTLRARLLARLAIELSFSSDRARLAGLSRDALALARRAGEPAALSPALIARHWSLWQPENVAERLATSTELLRLAEASGDRKIELQGHRWRMMNLLELGDVDAADGEIDAYARLARARRLPSELWYVHLFRGLRALMAGRYADVRAQIEAGLELGRRVGDTNADQGFTIQRALLQRDLGELAGVEEAVRANAERYPAIPGWRSLLAFVLLEAGRLEEARAQLEESAGDGFARIPRDGLWLGAMHLCAETAAGLGDVCLAAPLYERLRPYPDRNVVMGWASACAGSSSRALGLLAATLSRGAEAARHFEAALAFNERMGAGPLVARTCVDYGALLLGEGDDRGAALVRRGGAEARRLGMAPLAGRAAQLAGA